MIKNVLFAAALFVFGTVSSQNFEKKVLFNIDGNPVYASEFLSVYNKNLDLVQDESKNDIDEYLEMFINYKLKIKQAEALGLDTTSIFKREFKSYRNQLSHKYLTDVNVTEALIKEAYNRSVEEVNAAHILLKLNENAAPADTLQVYNKALELRSKIMDGANFETVAKQFSEDPSAKQNGGQLGWFNAFKMVYPFEGAAYKTNVGEISMPVRTNFGYHLIKVNDRRKSLGEVAAAHIMVSNSEEAEAEINNIYNKIQAGERFETLAKQYSDDKVTAVKGGLLNKFAAGKLSSPKFEEVAFGLTEAGEISAPFKTRFGWHIVKLVEKHSIPSFEIMKPELEKRIKNDVRSRKITEAFLQKLKSGYKIKDNEEAISFFTSYLPEDVLMGKWQPENLEELSSRNFLTIKDSTVTYKDFAKFIVERQPKSIKDADKKLLVKKWHDDFINNFVLTYHREHLEEGNKEFAAIVKEYKEGLLIFELMDREIWNKAKVDTVGLKQYYENNRAEYPQDIAFEETKGTIISDYQNYLESQWIKNLRQAANIELKKRTYKKIKKSLE